MKDLIQDLVSVALKNMVAGSQIQLPDDLVVHVERTRDNSHGDFATNIALILAKIFKKSPRELAQEIVKALPESEYIKQIDIAGPGFINFFLNESSQNQLIIEINQKAADYGKSDVGKNCSVLVEYVSTNPTGPLHVGHGRGAAYGASLANLLEFAGYDVTKEYYVNDAGRQMDILCISVWLRYLEYCGDKLNFPEKAYQGEYIRDIANTLYKEQATTYHAEFNKAVQHDLDNATNEDSLDIIISYAKQVLGSDHYKTIHQFALDSILKDIRLDLTEFGIVFDQWFSEQSLLDHKEVDKSLEMLKENDHLYEKDGATWFKSSAFGDEKDRVVIRENGQLTYFASDIAYHINKYSRGYNKIINIWGADHHGYISRVKAALEASGHDPEKLEILLVQFAVLYRGKEKVSMSTRSADYVTLRDLREETGNDAARFFYVTRKSEQHLDFDLDLATSETRDNPVFYIQYTHARIFNVIKKLEEQGYQQILVKNVSQLDILTEELESNLISMLSRFPEIITNAAVKYEPHQICYYLRNLANIFHSYYDKHKIVVEDENLRIARVSLIVATQQVIKNGLRVIGVSAPNSM